ncbi:MAG: hypothetical protein E5Y74_07145 [Mesorhizobium sp.]|nr:MAG: hypothetical protein E5Y74_07145 [Mesorhizobium sp.]
MSVVFMEIEYDDHTLVTTAAHELIACMEFDFQSKQVFEVGNIRTFMQHLVCPFPGKRTEKYPSILVRAYINVVSTLLERGEKSMSLLPFLKLLLTNGPLSLLIELNEDEAGCWLVSLPEFERRYQFQINARIPNAE